MRDVHAVHGTIVRPTLLDPFGALDGDSRRCRLGHLSDLRPPCLTPADVQALSVAFIVTYSITIRNLIVYDYIEVSTGPRLASNLAYLAGLAIPPVMAIIFFAYWSLRCWRTVRMDRDRGFLGALKVSFVGMSTHFLQAGLIMQSYHGSLQRWQGAAPPPTTDRAV